MFKNNEHTGGHGSIYPWLQRGVCKWAGPEGVTWRSPRFCGRVQAMEKRGCSWEAGSEGKEGNEQKWRILQRTGKRHTWSCRPSAAYERTEHRREQNRQKKMLLTRHLPTTGIQTENSRPFLERTTGKSEVVTKSSCAGEVSPTKQP